MILLKRFVFLLICTSAFVAGAQEESIFGPLAIGQPIDTVAHHLEEHSENIRKYNPSQTRFPLAEKTESHWLVEGYRSELGKLQRMALVFADGRLVYAQGAGGIQDMLSHLPDSSFTTYESFRFYKSSGLVVRPDQDKAWKLDQAGLHLNLFAWDHPMLHRSSWPDYSADVRIPEALEMGAPLVDLEPLLQKASSFIYRMELDGNDPNAQVQLDCFGMEYGGFSRKVEARFGDGKLNTVWILTAKPEEARLRALLQATYGSAVFVSEDWEAFENWQVFLRKDKPEILFLTEALGKFYKSEFFGQ